MDPFPGRWSIEPVEEQTTPAEAAAFIGLEPRDRRLAWGILGAGLALPTLCWLLVKVQFAMQDRESVPMSVFFGQPAHLSVTLFSAAPFALLFFAARAILSGGFPGLKDLARWERRALVTTAFAFLALVGFLSFMFVFQSDADSRVFYLAPVFSLALLGVMVLGLVVGLVVTSLARFFVGRGER